MNELDIAERVASGQLQAPQKFVNSWYVPLRISGTGVAWRGGVGEFCYRDPTIWLSPTMMRRCTGLLIIDGHPRARLMDGKEFLQRVVGVIVLSYPHPERPELWGVGRFLDGKLAETIVNPTGFVVDTSPSVSFADGATTTIELPEGEPLLVEGEPQLIDHLALCIAPEGEVGGVWSKGDPDNIGVDSNG